MNKKPRPDNSFITLTLDQETQLNEWLLTNSYTTVRSLLAKPPPEGMGLNVSESALVRYYARTIPGYLAARRNRKAQICQRLGSATAGRPIPFDTGAIDLLKQHLFSMMLSEQFDRSEASRLFRVILKCNDQDLVRERLRILRIKQGIEKNSHILTPEEYSAEFAKRFAAIFGFVGDYRDQNSSASSGPYQEPSEMPPDDQNNQHHSTQPTNNLSNSQ